MVYKISGKEKGDLIDWVAVGRPEEIVIPEGHKEAIQFVGIRGSKDNPVLIHEGDITLPISNSYGVKFDDCQHFEFFNTKITGANLGVTCEKRTTNFELNELVIVGSKSIGILAKDDSALRGQFVMTCKVHDCVVKGTGTEGIYIGNSKWAEGKAHECADVWVYDNLIKDSGWDGLQVGSCIRGSRIFNNKVFNAGLKNEANQRNGVQIGEGTVGLCYKNIVTGATGNGIQLLGPGNNMVYNNELSGCQENGIFANAMGPVSGSGFKIFGNVIDSPKVDGIRLYSKNIDHVVINNVLINPAGTYIYVLKGVSGTFSPNFMIRE